MNRLKVVFSSLLCLAATHLASAETWSLDSCIAYAVEHNLQVLLSDVSRQQAEQSLTQARSGYLPNVSANASQAWNLGRGLTAQNTYANRSTSTFNWGASASIAVFDGLATPRRINYAKANLAQVMERYEAAKEDVSINVISAYLQALYTKEMVEVAQRQVDLSEYELSRRQALLDAGKIPEVDLLEAKAQLANDRTNVVQNQNSYTMALVDLARLLRLSDDLTHFDVAPLSESEALIINPDDAFDLACRYSHNISAAQKGVVASDANIEVAKSGYVPTLSFGSSIGSTYYNVSGFTNDKFSRQMSNNFSTYFGFQLSIPIFDAFNTRNAIRQARVQKVEAQLMLDQAKDELYRTINDAYYQAVGAYEKYQASITSEEYASAAFEAMREKYALGRATPTEYEQANNKALQATADRIQAHYELILRSRILQFYASPH